MWAYPIGGYRVLEKYLKDRRGRRLDDPVRYIHIATAIARTMEVQEAIDALYPQVESETCHMNGLRTTARRGNRTPKAR